MVEFRRGGVGTRSNGGPTEVVPSQAHTFPAPGDTQPAPVRDPRRRANRYAGQCINGCGFKVEADAGYLAGGPGAWKAEHIECPTAPEVTPAKTEESVAPVTVTQTVVNGKVLFDGKYTLETLEGHRTFRLRTQASDDTFMPGKQIISFLSGQDNEKDYTNFGHVVGNQVRVWKSFRENGVLNADLKAFWADPTAALPSVQCYRCHRDLTVPTSVHNGLGPECVKKGI